MLGPIKPAVISISMFHIVKIKNWHSAVPCYSAVPLPVGCTKENDRNFTITVKAIDICGDLSQASFTIEVVRCPCNGLNGAACQWTDANQKDINCICPIGCTGKL